MRPMRRTLPIVLIFAACCAGSGRAAEPTPVVHHDLAVTIDPAGHRLKVHDRIRVPGALVTASFTMSLNADLAVQAAPRALKLTEVSSRREGANSGIDRDDHDAAFSVPIKVYRVEGATPGQELTGELDYEGVINN